MGNSNDPAMQKNLQINNSQNQTRENSQQEKLLNYNLGGNYEDPRIKLESSTAPSHIANKSDAKFLIVPSK